MQIHTSHDMPCATPYKTMHDQHFVCLHVVMINCRAHGALLQVSIGSLMSSLSSLNPDDDNDDGNLLLPWLVTKRVPRVCVGISATLIVQSWFTRFQQ